MTRLPHTPALDGLRGLAVAAVLLFHAGVPWAIGGHLGVTVFFALSGFLITSLLLSERDQTGRVDLPAFWARRAKRLVPAIILTLGLVAAVVAWTPNPADNALADSIATLTWSTNWWFLYNGSSYADLFADPSPLQHAWSLAVEEQYYLVFPLLLLVLLRGGRRGLLVGLSLLAVASVTVGALLSESGAASARMHYGTDTRVAEILAGALLAVLLQQGKGWRPVRSRVLGAAGGVCAALLLVAVVVAEDDSRFLQRGGWALVALATCPLLATAVQTGSVASRVLGVTPLVRLGQISYGAYLFHWPLFLLITEEATGMSGVGLLVVRLAAVLLLAELSLQIVELPVRQATFTLNGGSTSWALAGGTGLLVVALATGAISLPSLPTGPTIPVQAAGQPVDGQNLQRTPTTQQRQTQQSQQVRPQQQAPVAQQPAQRRQVNRSAVIPAAFAEDPDKARVPSIPKAGPDQLRVAVIGDSLGDNLGDGLAAWAQERSDVVVYNVSVPACPLSRGGERRASADRLFPVKAACGWWDDSSSSRRRALDAFDPQLVVMEDGVNELFDRRLPEWSEWRNPGDLTFDTWLVDEYEALIESLNGPKVLLLNTPCADWDRYDLFRSMDKIELRVSAVNVDHQRVAGVTRGDLMERLCPGGRYRDEVEGVKDGRPDGLHLSDPAALALSRNWLGPLVLKTAEQPTGLLGG